MFAYEKIPISLTTIPTYWSFEQLEDGEKVFSDGNYTLSYTSYFSHLKFFPRINRISFRIKSWRLPISRNFLVSFLNIFVFQNEIWGFLKFLRIKISDRSGGFFELRMGFWIRISGWLMSFVIRKGVLVSTPFLINFFYKKLAYLNMAVKLSYKEQWNWIQFFDFSHFWTKMFLSSFFFC